MDLDKDASDDETFNASTSKPVPDKKKKKTATETYTKVLTHANTTFFYIL